MERKRILLSSPHMSDEGFEKDFIDMAFKANWIAALGENVTEFESEVATLVNAGSSVAFNTGTSALHIALKAAGIGKGDKVLCQSFTFAASANPIVYLGATPVFVDSDLDSWNLSPEALKRAIKKYPDVKAVIVVHLYGLAAKLDEICEICRENNIILIEDAAESLGTLYKGRHTGSFGQFGVLSFNGNKIITTSSGGMLLINTENPTAVSDKVKYWITQSREKAIHYQHSEIGYNFRMSNVLAGIGRGQLKVLEQRKAKRKYIYNFYKNAFANIPEISLMPFLDDTDSNCWLSAIQLSSRVKPLDIINALETENIESRPVWKPMHLQPLYADCDYIDNGGVSEKLFRNGVCLPSDTKMTDEDLTRVTNIVMACFK